MKSNLLRIIFLLLSFLISETSTATVNNVQAPDLDADSLSILISAQEGNVEEIRDLISRGILLDIEDDYGRGPLHIAVEFGHTEVVRILIESGADTEARTGRALHTYFGWTPLMSAAYWGNLEAVDLLVKAGANVNAFESASRDNYPVLLIAITEGRITVVKQLIEYGADVNTTSEKRLSSPLYLATRYNHVELVNLFISMGSNVNGLDKESYSPLHAAAITGNPKIAKLLLDNGAHIESKSTGGSIPGGTPLHVAAYIGQLEFAQLLVKHKANVNSTSNYGYTPLRRAVDGGNLAMAKFLINKGADVNIQDNNGLTVLHIVAQTNMVSLARELIKLGSDVNALDKYSGFTPLDYAQDGEPKMLELLEVNGGICTSC